MKQIITPLLLALLFSCNDSNKEKELALKEKELELRERELNNAANKNDTTALTPAVAENKTTSNPGIENLIGNWNLANSPDVYIKFARDGRFEFNDYNAAKGQTEFLVGKYELAGNKLTLLYDDRAKQLFDFSMGVNGDKKYYIRRGNYYFVRGERVVQSMKDTTAY